MVGLAALLAIPVLTVFVTALQPAGDVWRHLADTVLAWLAAHPLDALEPEIVLVQSNGMAEWFKMRMADTLGVCAAAQVELPARFVWRSYRQILGKHEVPRESPLDKTPMIWRLMRILPQCLSEPAFAPIANFLRPGEPQRLYGADHRGIRGFHYGGNLHGGLLHHRFAVVMNIACNLQQTRRQLMRTRAKAVAIDIHAPFLFADHRDASGSGRPAICDCTCAAISPNEAYEFEMASSREIST